MCKAECFGNFHRKCQHYVKLYESGKRTDCGSPFCGVSSAHRHTARNCGCPKAHGEDRRVLNLIQDRCDACKQEAWATLERDSSRVW
ncbi:hypothetical protein OBBRIDRAFT_304031 [Obba rivulosa]|uniref:Uncharacterized protein n=1 Tax=Obba rivulosa TaxID=1052685 RepID=A0A8E2DPN1_9APHY|nr:hypothetical protein OBBRIDRAFT_304031 [Obba rivulosa]